MPIVLLLVAFGAMAHASRSPVGTPDPPKGWFVAGSHPRNYEMTVDTTVKHSGKASAHIKFMATNAEGFGTLMQMFRADDYRGKRVRMSAWIRSEDADSAQLWFRLDGAKGMSGFDNMDNRAVKGTSDWKKYDLTLDVPATTVNIGFGAMVIGKGQAWVDDFMFEVVGQDVPSTNLLTPEQMKEEQAPRQPHEFPQQPVNLNFEEGLVTREETNARTWYVVLQVGAADAQAQKVTEQTIAGIKKRLEALGVAGDVVPQGELNSARIRVSLPDVADRDRVQRLLTTAFAHLELRAVVSPPSPAPVQTYGTIEEAKRAAGANGEVIPYENAYGSPEVLPRSFIIVEKTPIVSGPDLRSAEAQPLTASSDYSIALTLNQDAAQRMYDWTGSHLNNFIAVVLNGTARSVAFVKSQFSGPFEISGHFSKTEAEDLSLLVRSGDLPASLKIIEEGQIRK